ncbi:hypothetical protein [Aurantiacibacter poecillastricola]|uniref:hypothetical protein n=1 Tax=Aurantiacibacter poecillastricola TaxID=3064385 RepID=UPI0027402DF1|nr:hypothetical protein [Aurantiacibacter sp. 219JJ12-13]MDP5262720.1 hypothetical protein [Aurantiacibacter sp. 219JJ12-13]
MQKAETTRSTVWRPILWSMALAVLLVPAIAMQFTGEVAWGPGDFLVMAGLLLGLGAAIELAARLGISHMAKSAAAGFAVVVFLTVWAELAVGIFD